MNFTGVSSLVMSLENWIAIAAIVLPLLAGGVLYAWKHRRPKASVDFSVGTMSVPGYDGPMAGLSLRNKGPGPLRVVSFSTTPVPGEYGSLPLPINIGALPTELKRGEAVLLFFKCDFLSHDGYSDLGFVDEFGRYLKAPKPHIERARAEHRRLHNSSQS